MSKREKLPPTRRGHTHKIVVGDETIYVTLNHDSKGNPREMFIKAQLLQGWCDVLSLTASLFLQRGGDLGVLLRHWRHQRFEPSAFGCSSLPDAIAAKLEEVAQ